MEVPKIEKSELKVLDIKSTALVIAIVPLLFTYESHFLTFSSLRSVCNNKGKKSNLNLLFISYSYRLVDSALNTTGNS